MAKGTETYKVKDLKHIISEEVRKQSRIKMLNERKNQLQNELKTLFKSIYEKRVFMDRSDEANPYDGGYLYDMYSLYLNSNNSEDFTSWLKEKNSTHRLRHGIMYL